MKKEDLLKSLLEENKKLLFDAMKEFESKGY